MASKSPLVPLPPSPGGETITVRLINPVNFGPSILKRFMGPDVPGVETFPPGPSFSFLLEHSSGRKLVFDLGIRKDWQNLAPDISNYIPSTNYTFDMDKNVIEILEENGVAGKDIEAVIWSHWHWDHIGDPSTFPSSTDLIVGPGFKEAMLPGAPANPRSHIQQSDYEGRNLREIDCKGPGSLQIGKFNAFDYFGDGSFYLIDSPGHAIGHLCGLARTTSSTTEDDTFIWLGGDICHYGGEMRPSVHLPMPDSITPHPCHLHDPSLSFCPGGAWAELQKIRDRKPNDTLYDLKFGTDIPLATITIGHLQEIDCDENVFVIIAHDRAVRDTVPHFPASINDWKAKGYGKNLKWAFLGDLKPFFQTKGVM